MLDLLLVLAFVAGLAWVAGRAFMKPDGIYLKSLFGFLGTAVLSAGIWFCAGFFIANEAGLGAVVIFLIIATASAIVAVVACASATARYVLDALAR